MTNAISMADVSKFLSENTTQYLATVDEDGKPHVRPFMMLAVIDSKCYFAVGCTKLVYKELLRNPNLEVAVATPAFDWLRISGKAVFVRDEEFKKKVVEISEVTASIYKKGDDPDFEIFYIDDMTITMADIHGKYKIIYKPEA